MKSLRVFAIGGWLSYRALFSWLQPSLFVMVLLIPSVTQMIFFVFLGRAASVENDTFFIVGNALVAAAVPCLFAMSQTIAEERFTLTLPALVVSPANRVALFLGRAPLSSTAPSWPPSRSSSSLHLRGHLGLPRCRVVLRS